MIMTIMEILRISLNQYKLVFLLKLNYVVQLVRSFHFISLIC